MRNIFHTILATFMAFMSFSMADQPCCQNENGNPQCPHYRAGVQLYFSGCCPEENIEGPRDDYEWPGMNEDAFYDYFTK